MFRYKVAGVKASLATCEESLAEAKEEGRKLILAGVTAAAAEAAVAGADNFSMYLQGAVIGAGMVALVVGGCTQVECS